MAITDFMALILAVLATLRVWFLGNIFQRQRAHYEALDSWRGKLMTCVLCLSFHATLLLTAGLVVPAILLPAPWSLIPRIPLYALAATTVVYWIWQLEGKYLHERMTIPPPPADQISQNSGDPSVSDKPKVQIKIEQAGVGPGHPKDHCQQCCKPAVYDDYGHTDLIATCTDTQYITLCLSCYRKMGNNVR